MNGILNDPIMWQEYTLAAMESGDDNAESWRKNVDVENLKSSQVRVLLLMQRTRGVTRKKFRKGNEKAKGFHFTFLIFFFWISGEGGGILQFPWIRDRKGQ